MSCKCQKDLKPFPKNITKLETIKESVLDTIMPIINDRADVTDAKLETIKDTLLDKIKNIKLNSIEYNINGGGASQSKIELVSNGPTGKISIWVFESGRYKEAAITLSNIGNLNRALNNPDSEPTEGSDNLITSGGVYNALSQIEPSNAIPIIYKLLWKEANAHNIDIDSCFVEDSNRVTLIINNRNDEEKDVMDLNTKLLYSGIGFPIHIALPFNMANTYENAIPVGGYMILNLYKIDLETFKDESVSISDDIIEKYHNYDHGFDNQTCYFITIGGVFEGIN